jgi:nicotinate dehydrogenase subunit A
MPPASIYDTLCIIAFASRRIIMPQSFSLNVNGVARTVTVEADTPLLYILRNDLELNGAKFGCGLAQCGACTVVVDGAAIRSCVTPVSAVVNKNITTIEGLGTAAKPHPLQKAFIEEQAVQCGYCINGMIMTAKAFLDRNPKPTQVQIKQALARNLCRCGTHNRIVRAIARAAKEVTA